MGGGQLFLVEQGLFCILHNFSVRSCQPGNRWVWVRENIPTVVRLEVIFFSNISVALPERLL